MSGSLNRIVVGYDGSQNARDALALGKAMVEGVGGTIILAYVMHDAMPSVGGWEDYKRGAHAAADHEFNRAVSWLGPEVPVEFAAVAARSDANGLFEAAERHNGGMIVVGSSHTGAVGRVVTGSVSERLLQGAPCPVVVAPVGLADAGFKLELVMAAYDDTDEGDKAVAQAAALARVAGCRLGLVSVLDPRVFADYSAYAAAGFESAALKEGHRTHLEELLEQKLAEVGDGLEAAGEVLEGDPAEVLEQAAGAADMLVLGSRGYGPLRSVLLGSVSRRLVRSAPCAVMVAPRGAAD